MTTDLQAQSAQPTLVDKKRWAAYAVAGAASALSAQSAEAAITYVNIGVAIDGVTPQSNDIQGFAINSGNTFIVGNLPIGTASTAGAALALMVGGNIAGFTAGPYLYAGNLASGSLVNTQAFLPTSSTATMAFGGGYTNSQFLSPGEAFIGFRFDSQPGNPLNPFQYGWARVRMDGPTANTFTWVDMAWGDEGEQILAGEGAPAPIPLPGSLGLLASGAVGLMGWRRRRAEAAAA